MNITLGLGISVGLLAVAAALLAIAFRVRSLEVRTRDALQAGQDELNRLRRRRS